jgi:hypothetical protein
LQQRQRQQRRRRTITGYEQNQKLGGNLMATLLYTVMSRKALCILCIVVFIRHLLAHKEEQRDQKHEEAIEIHKL